MQVARPPTGLSLKTSQRRCEALAATAAMPTSACSSVRCSCQPLLPSLASCSQETAPPSRRGTCSWPYTADCSKAAPAASPRLAVSACRHQRAASHPAPCIYPVCAHPLLMPAPAGADTVGAACSDHQARHQRWAGLLGEANRSRAPAKGAHCGSRLAASASMPASSETDDGSGGILSCRVACREEEEAVLQDVPGHAVAGAAQSHTSVSGASCSLGPEGPATASHLEQQTPSPTPSSIRGAPAAAGATSEASGGSGWVLLLSIALAMAAAAVSASRVLLAACVALEPAAAGAAAIKLSGLAAALTAQLGSAAIGCAARLWSLATAAGLALGVGAGVAGLVAISVDLILGLAVTLSSSKHRRPGQLLVSFLKVPNPMTVVASLATLPHDIEQMLAPLRQAHPSGTSLGGPATPGSSGLCPSAAVITALDRSSPADPAVCTSVAGDGSGLTIQLLLHEDLLRELDEVRRAAAAGMSTRARAAGVPHPPIVFEDMGSNDELPM